MEQKENEYFFSDYPEDFFEITDDLSVFRGRTRVGEQTPLATEIVGTGGLHRMFNITNEDEIEHQLSLIHDILSRLPEAFQIRYQANIEKIINNTSTNQLEDLYELRYTLENVLRFYSETKFLEERKPSNMALPRLLYIESNQHPNLFDRNIGKVISGYYQIPEHYQVWFNEHYNFYNRDYSSLIGFLAHFEGMVGILLYLENNFLEQDQSRSLQVIKNRIKKLWKEIKKNRSNIFNLNWQQEMIESYDHLCDWFDENIWRGYSNELDSSYAIYEINQLVRLILDSIKREEEELEEELKNII